VQIHNLKQRWQVFDFENVQVARLRNLLRWLKFTTWTENEVSGFGHVKLSGSANAEAEIVIFSINQVVNFHNLKLVCSPEITCCKCNTWNYQVVQMHHVKLRCALKIRCVKRHTWNCHVLQMKHLKMIFSVAAPAAWSNVTQVHCVT